MKIVQYPNSKFKLYQPFEPAGDQPTAIAGLVEGLNDGLQYQTLLGVTGSGKTYTMANIIAQTGRAACIMVHNKTLAAQLYAEFRDFFPENAVEYFVSYYDYYQPEAYVPHKDLFIEKEYRGNGAGKLTMEALALIAVQLHCNRMVWAALDWNTPAIEFYKRLGATIQKGLITTRLINDDLITFAQL